jgi:hypothetical protein
METYATLYVTDDSNFSLRAAARMLRSLDPGPDRVEQNGKDELRIYLEDWCLKIAWEKGAAGRRAIVACDADPEIDHIDDYVELTDILIDHFRGVMVFDHGSRIWYWHGKGEKAPAPVPSHLADWLAGIEVHEEGTYVEGGLRCPCGSERFEFHYPGTTHLDSITGMPIPCSAKLPGPKDSTRYWFGLRAICAACRRECLLFDSELHGWNAFPPSARTAKQAERSRPQLWPW